jgi:hypothetical protein
VSEDIGGNCRASYTKKTLWRKRIYDFFLSFQKQIISEDFKNKLFQRMMPHYLSFGRFIIIIII